MTGDSRANSGGGNVAGAVCAGIPIPFLGHGPTGRIPAKGPTDVRRDSNVFSDAIQGWRNIAHGPSRSVRKVSSTVAGDQEETAKRLRRIFSMKYAQLETRSIAAR